MGIFRALGFGLFLIVLFSLMPAVFAELSETIIVFLKSSQEALIAAGTLAASAGHLPPLK